MVQMSENSGNPSTFALAIHTLSDMLLSKSFWLAFIVSGAISFTIYNLVQNEEYMRLESDFNEKVEESHSNLLMQISRSKDFLYAARSIYTALPEGEKRKWSQAIQSLPPHAKSPGQEGYAFIQNVTPNEFYAKGPSCFISMYSMPETFPNAEGYNICANPIMAKTMLKAGETGEIAASPPTPFDGLPTSENSISLFIPVYTTDAVPTNFEERQNLLQGWIATPIKIQALFENIVRKENGLEFQLFQGPPSPQNLLFQGIKENNVKSSLDLSAKKSLQINGQLYTIFCLKRNIESYIQYSIPLIFLSLLFSLLGGILIWNLYTNKYRAEKLAEKMAKSLTDKEDTMKKLLDSSPGAIYTHSNEENWSVTFVSDYFFRLTGYAPADYKTRRDFDEIIHPDDLGDARYEIQASITENEFYEVEYRIIKADQSIIWVMDKGYVERHKNKEFVRGVMVDITKTKRIERASQQLNNALMHMAEGISLVDRRGIFIEINPAFSIVSGWDIKDLPGTYFAKTIHPEDREEAEKLFDKLHRREKSSGELRALQPDGSCVYMSIIFVGLYDDSNGLTGAYMFVRDISDRKTSEEKLRKAKEEISMAYKTKSDFLATMSHEIRSPLNVIIGYSDMLREELSKKAPELTEDIKAIQGAGAHLLDLVNDIIDISKLETGQTKINFHVFDVRDIVENVVSAVSSVITVNHNKLDVIIGANLDLMNSDFAKIRQSLINLINNAAKFTYKGHIELSIKASGRNHEWIHFCVTDTGNGIPAEKLKNLFTPFVTKSGKANEKIKGTGLGLPIVKHYSELLGGHIDVHSEEGKGSTFEIILPRGNLSSIENDKPIAPLLPQTGSQ